MKRPRPRIGFVEHLESRRLLASIVVTTGSDVVDASDALISLREALSEANNSPGVDEIRFTDSVTQIDLALGELMVSDSVEIFGTSTRVTINAGHHSRVINVGNGDDSAAIDVALNDVVITGGQTIGPEEVTVVSTLHAGGGIRFISTGTLELNRTTVSNSHTLGDYGYGGGIYTREGTVTLNQSRLSGNSTTGDHSSGGAILAWDSVFSLIDSEIVGNAISGDVINGGGVYLRDGTIDITGTSVVGNETFGLTSGSAGLYLGNADFSITDSEIRGNIAVHNGGGITLKNGVGTITNSLIRDNKVTARSATGGGIFSAAGDLTVVNSEVSHNQATGEFGGGGGVSISGGTLSLNGTFVSQNMVTGNQGHGGGIATRTGSVTLNDSVVSKNIVVGPTAFGAGINTYSGAVSVIGSTISENINQGETLSAGGGIHTDTGPVTVRQSVITKNQSASVGGGIATKNGDVEVVQSEVSWNQTSGIYSNGGGIGTTTLGTGAVTVLQSSFVGNRTTGEQAKGGGVHVVGKLVVTDSTFFQNSTVGDSANGGGVSAGTASATITNSTFSSNQVSGRNASGGAIDIIGSRLLLLSSTVTDNHSLQGRGAGIRLAGSANSTDYGIRNSIIAGNHSTDLDFPNGPNVISVQHSLIGVSLSPFLLPTTPGVRGLWGNIIGSAELPIDPLIAPIADNGGATMTHALLDDSPAIDVGDRWAVAEGDLVFDQRGTGYGRIADGLGDGESRIDMGAYELHPSSYDFGDAPSTFPTQLVDDGARHVITSLFLGLTIDDEEDGLATPEADGDGSGDDGVTVLAPMLSVSDSDTTASFRVTATESGRLDAWIDFNGDGDWLDDGEQVAESLGLDPGTDVVSVLVPSDAIEGPLVARFRVSTEGGLSPSGPAESGEVEDYLFELLDDEQSPYLPIDLGSWSAVLSVGNSRFSITNAESMVLDLPSYSDATVVITAAGDDGIAVDDVYNWRMGTLTFVDQVPMRELVHVASDHPRLLVDLPSPWRNAIDRSDVNNNGLVSPTDALMIINELAARSFSDADTNELMDPADVGQWPGRYFDHNGDGRATPIDALRVINELARRLNPQGSGEGVVNFDMGSALSGSKFKPSQSDGDAGALAVMVAKESQRELSWELHIPQDDLDFHLIHGLDCKDDTIASQVDELLSRPEFLFRLELDKIGRF